MQPPALSKYEILGLLGQGGTGAVYKARHRASGRLVAIKIISDAHYSDPVQLKRLEQEFLTLRRLAHPGIVRGLDFGQEESNHYLVMELLEGFNLGERIERHGRLPEAVAVGIIAEVAHALKAAHDAGLVHRDVKPGNVMLTRQGQVKLMDFGVVKEIQSDLVLTQVNDLLGTPVFMAPEQFDGPQTADARSDVYSLGATLFTAVTGQIPFPGKNCLMVLTRKIHHPLPLPSRFAPELSAGTEQLILRCLHPDPAKRPASCAEFLAEVDAAMLQPPAEAMLEVFRSSPGGACNARIERRSHPRRRAKATVRYRPKAVSEALPARAILVDASVHGVQLVVQERHSVGDAVEVELRAPKGTPVMVREAHVRWVGAEPGSFCFRLGCSWKRPFNHSELRCFS